MTKYKKRRKQGENRDILRRKFLCYYVSIENCKDFLSAFFTFSLCLLV
nr:MAG TPA: hypothetical protein [Caudoviricetes sp.]